MSVQDKQQDEVIKRILKPITILLESLPNRELPMQMVKDILLPDAPLDKWVGFCFLLERDSRFYFTGSGVTIDPRTVHMSEPIEWIDLEPAK